MQVERDLAGHPGPARDPAQSFIVTTDRSDLLRGFLNGFGYPFTETTVHIDDLVQFLSHLYPSFDQDWRSPVYPNAVIVETTKIASKRWAREVRDDPGMSAKAAFVELRDTIRALPYARWGCMLRSCIDLKGREWWVRAEFKGESSFFVKAFPHQNGRDLHAGQPRPTSPTRAEAATEPEPTEES